MKALKLRQRVVDRWYPELGVGIVLKVLKTRARIRFGSDVQTYDREHYQFLEKPE
ncbi:hypothetical protein [Myxococcus phage Mx1]|nr:hypothetical protein [Myxococcus phage Mx1]